MLPGPSERHEPVLERAVDEEMDPNPCEEDEEYFMSRPNAEEMEQAIGKFLDGMPALESNGYQQLHRHLAKLPVPGKQTINSMTHTEAVEGGFLNTMSEEELKRFTPTEVLLYKHAVEYRYIAVHTNHIQVHMCTC